MAGSEATAGEGAGFSRRALIKGVIAAGAAASSAAYLFRTAGVAQGAPSSPAASAQASERLLSLKVNGVTRRVEVPHHETLAHTLRYRLGLTGTKIGCDRAECGNCTVLIDGVPRYSCSTLTHTVRAKEITTIEGLTRPNGQLHPVQQALVDELAFQCGFCTPGMVMSAVALLQRNPHPTRPEVMEALSGNLCRCGTYEHYARAVLRAAERVG